MPCRLITRAPEATRRRRTRYPESPVFYRRLDRAFPCAVAAEGSYVIDENGKRYLDSSGGAMAPSRHA